MKSRLLTSTVAFAYGLLFKCPQDSRALKVADLVDDSTPAVRARVLEALKDPAHKDDRDHVDVIIALGMAKFDWIWCEREPDILFWYLLSDFIHNYRI